MNAILRDVTEKFLRSVILNIVGCDLWTASFNLYINRQTYWFSFLVSSGVALLCLVVYFVRSSRVICCTHCIQWWFGRFGGPEMFDDMGYGGYGYEYDGGMGE